MQSKGAESAATFNLDKVRDSPRPAPPRDILIRQAAARRSRQPEARQRAIDSEGRGGEPLNELQRSILSATQELRRRGHPANTP
jgi:hypothetical protein